MTDRNIVAQLVLVLITFFWGSTFLTLQIALRWADPIVIVAMRFALASFIIFCLLKGRVDQITRYEWKAGFFVGPLVFNRFLAVPPHFSLDFMWLLCRFFNGWYSKLSPLPA